MWAKLSPDDPLRDMLRLAGLMPVKSILENSADPTQSNTAAGIMSPVGSNISMTGMEKRDLEKKHHIKPGSDEWFKLWFSRPYLTGEKPIGDDKAPKYKNPEKLDLN